MSGFFVFKLLGELFAYFLLLKESYDVSYLGFLLLLTVSIRIVADCVALSCQVTRKLERAITLEFTKISAIIFILCYRQFLLVSVCSVR